MSQMGQSLHFARVPLTSGLTPTPDVLNACRHVLNVPISDIGSVSCQLDASVEASGPHDFAVRVRAVRQGHFHVHRIPHPTSVTTAKRPSCGHETAIHWTDLVFLKIRIFFLKGAGRRGR